MYVYCGGIGIGLSVCMGHSMCVRLHVHVGHDKVIVYVYEPPYLHDVWLRHKAWAECHYIRYGRLCLFLSVYIYYGP